MGSARVCARRYAVPMAFASLTVAARRSSYRPTRTGRRPRSRPMKPSSAACITPKGSRNLSDLSRSDRPMTTPQPPLPLRRRQGRSAQERSCSTERTTPPPSISRLNGAGNPRQDRAKARPDAFSGRTPSRSTSASSRAASGAVHARRALPVDAGRRLRHPALEACPQPKQQSDVARPGRGSMSCGDRQRPGRPSAPGKRVACAGHHRGSARSESGRDGEPPRAGTAPHRRGYSPLV